MTDTATAQMTELFVKYLNDEAIDEMVADALGMALDNGHDMRNTNPEEHMRLNWDGYIATQAEMEGERILDRYGLPHEAWRPLDEVLRALMLLRAPSYAREELGMSLYTVAPDYDNL